MRLSTEERIRLGRKLFWEMQYLDYIKIIIKMIFLQSSRSTVQILVKRFFPVRSLNAVVRDQKHTFSTEFRQLIRVCANSYLGHNIPESLMIKRLISSTRNSSSRHKSTLNVEGCPALDHHLLYNTAGNHSLRFHKQKNIHTPALLTMTD